MKEESQSPDGNLWSRRRFLRAALPTALMLGTGSLMAADLWRSRGRERQPEPEPWSVAVIGAGLAGLTTAFYLHKKGLNVTVFEASARTGGRVSSAKGTVAEGVVTELGGEFISSHHKEVLNLARLFHLPLVDRHHSAKSHFHNQVFLTGGQTRSAEVIRKAMKPVFAKIQADATRSDRQKVLESQSLAHYLASLSLEPWLQRLLSSIYASEFGCEVESVAALSLLQNRPHMQGKQIHFTRSDKRYQIAGGNQRLIDTLAKQLQGKILTGQPLIAAQSRGKKFHLSFQGGMKQQVDAVVVTAPFSSVRKMDLQLNLPKTLSRFIRELSYGNHSKSMVGFTKRFWQEKAYLGNIVSDTVFQQAWEHSLFQSTAEAGITFQVGGKASEQWQAQKPSIQQLLAPTSLWLPSLSQYTNGKISSIDWGSQPWQQGSLSFLRPGEYHAFAKPHLYHNRSIEPVGLDFFLFAGEHLSAEHPGTMNGAIQTGRIAAQHLMKWLLV